MLCPCMLGSLLLCIWWCCLTQSSCQDYALQLGGSCLPNSSEILPAPSQGRQRVSDVHRPHLLPPGKLQAQSHYVTGQGHPSICQRRTEKALSFPRHLDYCYSRTIDEALFGHLGDASFPLLQDDRTRHNSVFAFVSRADKLVQAYTVYAWDSFGPYYIHQTPHS